MSVRNRCLEKLLWQLHAGLLRLTHAMHSCRTLSKSLLRWRRTCGQKACGCVVRYGWVLPDAVLWKRQPLSACAAAVPAQLHLHVYMAQLLSWVQHPGWH